jgi:hypothetical protein
LLARRGRGLFVGGVITRQRKQLGIEIISHGEYLTAGAAAGNFRRAGTGLVNEKGAERP